MVTITRVVPGISVRLDIKRTPDSWKNVVTVLAYEYKELYLGIAKISMYSLVLSVRCLQRRFV